MGQYSLSTPKRIGEMTSEEIKELHEEAAKKQTQDNEEDRHVRSTE